MRHTPLNGSSFLNGSSGWPPLVAVAHGSTDPRAAAAITALLAQVTTRASARGLPPLQVRAAYLGHALPSVPAVLESLSASGNRSAVVLPLLLTDAYHSDTDLPRILRDTQSRLPALHLSYGQPLGPHPALLLALQHRLAEAGAGGGLASSFPGQADSRPASAPQRTAVVLAAAGSSRPEANAEVARLARRLQEAGGWGCVTPAYASAASPSPAEAVAGLLRGGAERVAVASYLLAPGLFADRVRDQSLAAGAHAVSAPLGAAPEVADAIIDRYLRVTCRGECVREHPNVLKWDDGGCNDAPADIPVRPVPGTGPVGCCECASGREPPIRWVQPGMGREPTSPSSPRLLTR